MIELGPNDPIPEDVVTTFLGAEGETAENTNPEDTWDPGGNFIPDGRHLYEIPTYGFGPTNRRGRAALTVAEMHLSRPIVTKRYIEEANARAVAKGHDPVYIRWDEIPVLRQQPTLTRRILGKLGKVSDQPKNP